MVHSKYCVICGKHQSEVSRLYCFPLRDKRCSEWFEAMGIRSIRPSARICSEHFTKKCFYNLSTMKLLPTAIPTLFPARHTQTPEQLSNELPSCSTAPVEMEGVEFVNEIIIGERPSCSIFPFDVEEVEPLSEIIIEERPSCHTAPFEVEGVEPLSEIIEERPSSSTALFGAEGLELLSENIEDEFVDVCRICLKPTYGSIKFSQQNRDSIVYERMVESVFPDLKINMYPHPAICVYCEAELQIAYDFKNLWSRSEHILQEFVSKQTQDKDITKTLLLDFVANSNDKLLELAKDPGNKDFIVDDQDPVDVEIAGQDRVSNSEVLEDSDSVMVQENNGDSDDVQQIIPGEHDYCGQNQTFSTRRKLAIPDIYNLLDEKYDVYFAKAVCLRSKHFELKRRLKKLGRPDPGEPPYLCEICGHVFKTYIRYQRHVDHHKRLQRKVDFVCEICGLLFSDTNLRQHYSTHKPRNYTCNVCNRKFLGVLQLRRHLESGLHERKYGQCHLCGKKVTRLALRSHLLSHKTVQCQVCDKVLPKNAFAKHLKWHREGGYKCPLCVKVLKNKYCLDIHITAVHDKNNDFKCGICGKAYSLRCRLKRHITKIHLNSSKQKENVSAVTKSQEEIWIEDDNET